MAFFLESIEQNYNFTFIKYEEDSENVSSIFGTQLIQSIPNKFNKLLGKSVLSFKQE